MNKDNFFQILYVVLIIGLILFMIFIVFYLKGEGADCLSDPIQYYFDKMGDQCQVFCEVD